MGLSVSVGDGSLLPPGIISEKQAQRRRHLARWIGRARAQHYERYRRQGMPASEALRAALYPWAAPGMRYDEVTDLVARMRPSGMGGWASAGADRTGWAKGREHQTVPACIASDEAS